MKRLVKRLIPRSAERAIRDLSDLPREARWEWMRAATSRLLGTDIVRLPEALPDNPLVLFVCHGNIYRSPVAAEMMRRAVARRPGAPIRVESAGLLDRSGRPAPEDAKIEAAALGFSLAEHASQPITPELAASANVIVVMDRRNEALIRARFPGIHAKLLLLGAMDPMPSEEGPVIIDPYPGGAERVRACYARISRCVTRLHDVLSRGAERVQYLSRWKRIARSALTATVLDPVWRQFTRDSAAVLMLHRFEDREAGVFGHSEDVLISHLEYLRREKFSICSADELVDAVLSGRPLPPRSVAFTVDDGYSDFGRVGAPIFAKYDVPATLFVTTGFLDGETWLWHDAIRYLVCSSAHPRVTFKLADELQTLTWRSPAERNSAIVRLIERFKMVNTDAAEAALVALSEAVGVQLPERPTPDCMPISWADVRAWSSKGMLFGAHSRTHAILSRASEGRSAAEIVDSVSRVREMAGAGAAGVFAYPNGTARDFSERESRVLQRVGVRGAFASVGGHSDASTILSRTFAIPRIPYSDDYNGIRQSLMGAERLKALLRGVSA